MSSVVCTLFENHYHYGVAALINSLHRYQFEGAVFAGYKGQLPSWANKVQPNSSFGWPGASSFKINRGIHIHFLPLETTYHMANYKPAFMIELLEGPAKNASSITYFDPDIVIKCRWSFFEKWINYGVAMVHEIISNDMPATHPVRLEWKEIIHQNDGMVRNNILSYINSGFCGVSRENFGFLKTWKQIVDFAIEKYKPDPEKFMSFDRTYPFFSIDQDAFNIAAMCTECSISELGPEAMDFMHGGWTMSHAVGAPKPWRKNFFLNAIKGVSPSIPDREYWANVSSPLSLYSKSYIKLKSASLLFAAFIARFYKRN